MYLESKRIRSHVTEEDTKVKLDRKIAKFTSKEDIRVLKINVPVTYSI